MRKVDAQEIKATAEQSSVDGCEELVIEKIRARRDKGLQKYGVSVEREDLSMRDWLQHAQEEALDLAIYLERIRKGAGKPARKVKPLVWDEHLSTKALNGGHYGVVCWGNKSCETYLAHKSIGTSLTILTAKAIAQADHEKACREILERWFE